MPCRLPLGLLLRQRSPLLRNARLLGLRCGPLLSRLFFSQSSLLLGHARLLRLLSLSHGLLLLRRARLLGRLLLLRLRRLLLRHTGLLRLNGRALCRLLLLHLRRPLLSDTRLLGLSRRALLRLLLLRHRRLLLRHPCLLLLCQCLSLAGLNSGALLRRYGLLLLAKRGSVGLRLLLHGLRVFGCQPLAFRLRALSRLLLLLLLRQQLGALLLQRCLMRGGLLGALLLLLLRARLLRKLLRCISAITRSRTIKRGRIAAKALALPPRKLLSRRCAGIAFIRQPAAIVALVLVLVLLAIVAPFRVIVARHIPLRPLAGDHPAPVCPLRRHNTAPLPLIVGEAQGPRPLVIARGRICLPLGFVIRKNAPATIINRNDPSI